jgi:hypothetical protein
MLGDHLGLLIHKKYKLKKKNNPMKQCGFNLVCNFGGGRVATNAGKSFRQIHWRNVETSS